ncbi:Uncharacterised protein [Fusobacterium necrophorum subsp. necrophorum]|nr:hypothetical protein [Fusobacterium necrophorum]SQD10513.1 Uncharacterised protein [Fusobacterium necrophorum subsp. necrophorum]
MPIFYRIRNLYICRFFTGFVTSIIFYRITYFSSFFKKYFILLLKFYNLKQDSKTATPTPGRESKNPIDYLKKMTKRDEQLAFYLGTNCPQIEMKSSNGKKRKILAGNMKDIFRIIQSIPSPKAEPFKLWLAEVGKE